MNKENVLAVADAIEQHTIPDLGFNMSYCVASANNTFAKDQYGTNCGTVACIAGWARAVRTGVVPEKALTFNDFLPEAEAEWLGLREGQMDELFYPDELASDYDDEEDSDKLSLVLPEEAVAVLRHLAETGEVDWSVADKVTA